MKATLTKLFYELLKERRNLYEALAKRHKNNPEEKVKCEALQDFSEALLRDLEEDNALTSDYT